MTPLPIESAPQDRSEILAFIPCLYHPRWVIAKWDTQPYNRKPVPYWAYSDSVLRDKARQPTHWLPMPPFPKQEPLTLAPE